MFELIFGGMFCFLSLIFTVVMLGAGLLGGEPFVLFFLLFLIPFWVIGIVFFRKGIQKIQTDNETKKWGRDSYGLVIKFFETNSYVNGYPVLDVDILVLTDCGVERFRETAGTNPNYDIGDYVIVKYHGRDINILKRAPSNTVPDNVKKCILELAPTNIICEIENYKIKNQDFIVDGEYIIIDGVKYKRPT